MARVGIVTMSGNYNYGNRLQAYAMQAALVNLGHFAVTLEFPGTDPDRYRYGVRRQARLLTSKVADMVKPRASTLAKRAKSLYLSEFSDSYICENSISRRELSEQNCMFDSFIVGSDQVWNPGFCGKDPSLFLRFASPEKRISYAASFGVETIPFTLRNHYSNMLSGMASISVRENSGRKLVRDLIGVDAPVVADPTMLQTSDDWLSIADVEAFPVAVQDPYILVYVLRHFSEEIRARISKFAKTRKFKIIQVLGDFFDSEATVLTPLQFIRSISQAQMVLTDSFHGAAISTIMKTPLAVIQRADGNMGSRLSHLLDTFDINRAVYSASMQFESLGDLFDSGHTDKTLERVRTEGLNFLKSVL